jgi:pimeloyl-ACP methyl ester carboxylesterase
MSLWHNPAYDSSQTKMPTSTVNPLEVFTSCAISNIAVGEATIHTLYRPAQPGASDIVLVLIHGYPQTHIMWRSVYPQAIWLM